MNRAAGKYACTKLKPMHYQLISLLNHFTNARDNQKENEAY